MLAWRELDSHLRHYKLQVLKRYSNFEALNWHSLAPELLCTFCFETGRVSILCTSWRGLAKQIIVCPCESSVHRNSTTNTHMYVVETTIAFLVLKGKRKFWGNCYSMCADILLFSVTKLFIFFRILCTVLALEVFSSPFMHFSLLFLSSFCFCHSFPYFVLQVFETISWKTGENGEICALQKLINK